MKRVILAAGLLAALAVPAFGQGTPNSSTVVAACGTPPATYTAGQNKPNLQDTTGRQCQTGTVAVTGTVPADQGTPNAGGASAWPVTVGATSKASSSALAANLVVSASGASLFSFQVAADSTLSSAAWWVMVYDAASAPGDGTVTPALCYAMPSGATAISAGFGAAPMAFATGIVIGVSTNGCFTKAASTHAFINGGYK